MGGGGVLRPGVPFASGWSCHGVRRILASRRQNHPGGDRERYRKMSWGGSGGALQCRNVAPALPPSFPKVAQMPSGEPRLGRVRTCLGRCGPKLATSCQIFFEVAGVGYVFKRWPKLDNIRLKLADVGRDWSSLGQIWAISSNLWDQVWAEADQSPQRSASGSLQSNSSSKSVPDSPVLVQQGPILRYVPTCFSRNGRNSNQARRLTAGPVAHTRRPRQKIATPYLTPIVLFSSFYFPRLDAGRARPYTRADQQRALHVGPAHPRLSIVVLLACLCGRPVSGDQACPTYVGPAGPGGGAPSPHMRLLGRLRSSPPEFRTSEDRTSSRFSGGHSLGLHVLPGPCPPP